MSALLAFSLGLGLGAYVGYKGGHKRGYTQALRKSASLIGSIIRRNAKRHGVDRYEGYDEPRSGQINVFIDDPNFMKRKH